MLDINKFRYELESQRMTISELSDRSGMSYAHLSNIKNGKVKNIKLETVRKIAHHLNDIPLYRLVSDPILELGRQDFLDSIRSLEKKDRLLYLEKVLGKEVKMSVRSNRIPIVGHVEADGRHTLPPDFGKTDFPKDSYSTIPFDNIDDSAAYAVVLDDPTLSPDMLGSILLFGPKYPVDKLSLCLVRFKANGRVWIRYVSIVEDQCILLTKGIIADPVVLNLNDIDLMHRCIGRYFADQIVSQ